MQSRISNLRLVVQVTSMVVINLGLFGVAAMGTSLLISGLPVPTFACHYFEGRIVECFIYQLQHYLTSGSVTFLATSAIIWAIMCVVVGRFLCGWVCPLGFTQDLISRARKSLRVKYVRLSLKLNNHLGQFRYLLIAILAFISFIISTGFVSAVYRRSFDLPGCQICPSKSLWLISQAILGIMPGPPILPEGWGVEKAITLITIASISVFAVGSFSIRRFWCRFCPLGGLDALFKRVSAIHLSKDEVKCTKCGICKRVCPTQVNTVYEEKGGDVTSSNCTLCLRCVEKCPQEECLKVNLMGVPIYKSKDWAKH